MKKLVDKLKFEDRIEYNIDKNRFLNEHGVGSIINFIFICTFIILSIPYGFSILIPFGLWIVFKIIDELIYYKKIKKLNSKYFEFKLRSKR